MSRDMEGAMNHRWDPDRYLTYADERGRPFVELVARVDANVVRSVVDLGCGPGNLTRMLVDRWPAASVVGLDSSAEMIARAAADGDGRVRFEVGDLRSWRSAEPVDVLVSNATLQWVPGHLDLLGDLVAQVRPGGWFALQVPGNMGEASHTLLAALAAEEPYAAFTTGAASPVAHDAATYWRALTELGCEVDAWETTYLHVLHGPDPVFTWVSGTGARPTLQALEAEPGLRAAFETELKSRLAQAYPDTGNGVLFPFRRVFAVARVPR